MAIGRDVSNFILQDHSPREFYEEEIEKNEVVESTRNVRKIAGAGPKDE